MFIDLPPQVNGLSQLDHWQGNGMRGLEPLTTFAQGLLGYAYSHLPYSNSSETDIATDDAVTNDLASTYSKMAQGAWAANNDPMSQWNGRRSVIQYLNQFLAIADNVKWADDPIAAKVFAESRKAGTGHQ